MSYGTIYTLPFQSTKEVDCIVEIQKENYDGRSIELTGSGDAPFSVELSDEDFLYTPSRFSVATIRVIGNDYLQALYSTGYQQYRVNFKQGNRVVWTGFVTPELYTQDYTSTLFDLEIQCVSAMSVLEYIKYKEVGEKRAFVSLWDLLKKCVSESRGSYSSVYIPHVYAASEAEYNTSANILQSMTVSEQDFFDEDDEPMTLKEVLEEICKLLGWTCVDYRGELFFVDADHKGIYRKYSVDLSTFEAATPGTLKVQDIGFSGADHSLDILGGYNKAVVKVSNYNAGQIFPEEDFNNLDLFSGMIKTQAGDSVTVKNFYYSKVYKLYQYSRDAECRELTDYELDLYKKSPTLTPNDILGAMPIKSSNYSIVDGKPDIFNYSWEDLIQVRRSFNTSLSHVGYIHLSEKKVLSFRKPLPVGAYPDGAFAINFSIQLTGNEDLTADDKKRTYTPYVACSLHIGDYYYNGQSWSKSDGMDSFRINVPFNNSSGFVSCENTKTLEMPYDDITGFVIPLPSDKVLVGELRFDMYVLMPKGTEGVNFNKEIKGYYIKDLKMQYAVKKSIFGTSDNSDRYYENVVNESYVNPADEIEFKISSYNNDGACYSKVMLGDNYLTDNLYSAIEGKPIRPEEGLIRRIVNQYSATKIRLTQVLKYSDSITPIISITDKFQPEKRFLLTGGEIDFANDSFTVKMVQNGN